MSRDTDAHTHPNQTRPGIAASWRNSNGSRPRNPRVVERDSNVARLRLVLVGNPHITVAEVMEIFGIVKSTAKKYLARARRPT